jgi:mono/diheme cytochrome c family protein
MRGILLLLTIVLLFTGCKPSEAQTEESNPTEELFNKRCAGCHGFDGEPAKSNLPNIPDFRDPDYQKRRTDKQLIDTIMEGRKPLMPSFKSNLDDEQIKALVAYIRSLAKKKEK